LKLFAGGDDPDALLVATARGDEQAFARLYTLTAAKLFGVLVRILRRGDLAEEVMQEVYVSVWQRADTYAVSRGGALPWLIQIARNRALDRWRRSIHEVADPDADLEAIPDGAPALEARLAADQDARRVNDCLERLGERQRECVTLAYFEGLSHSEVAERLAVPIGSVKTWIRRGLLALRECLGS
jgi:RNA polymerase sigma-70 factor (ECF subfamily)